MLCCNVITTCKFSCHKIQKNSLRVLINSLTKSEHRSCCKRNCSGFEDFGSGSTRGCSINYWPCSSACNVGFSKGCHGRLCYAYSGGKAGPGCTGGCGQSAEISPGKLWRCELWKTHYNCVKHSPKQEKNTTDQASRNVRELPITASSSQIVTLCLCQRM